MLVLDNKKLNKIRKILEVSNSSIRTVVYFGIAEAVVNYILKRKGVFTNSPALSLEFDKYVDWFNEISIIDRDLFKNCLRKVYNLRTVLINFDAYSKRLEKIFVFNSILELSGITEAYSVDDVYEINKHFDVYREAVHATLELLNSKDASL